MTPRKTRLRKRKKLRAREKSFSEGIIRYFQD